MAGKRVQILGHPQGEAITFRGRAREITVNTTIETIHVHDGTTPGGMQLARFDLANTPDATASVAGRMSPAQVQELTQASTDIATNAVNIAANAANIQLLADNYIPDIPTPVATFGVKQTTAGKLITAGFAYERQFAGGSTVITFTQPAAPTSWQIVAGWADRVMLLSDTGGAAFGGSWTISGLDSSEHVLTVTELPGHTHPGSTATQTPHSHGANLVWTQDGNNATIQTGGVAKDSPQPLPAAQPAITVNVATQGGGQGHNHPVVSNTSWRPLYISAIPCVKISA